MHGWSADPADKTEGGRVVGDLVQTIEPLKGRTFLPKVMLAWLRNKEFKRASLLGLSQEPDEVRVTLRGEGDRVKTMLIDDEKMPAISYLLNETDEPALSRDAFVSRCQEYAKEDLFPGLGQEWKTEWNNSPPAEQGGSDG